MLGYSTSDGCHTWPQTWMDAWQPSWGAAEPPGLTLFSSSHFHTHWPSSAERTPTGKSQPACTFVATLAVVYLGDSTSWILVYPFVGEDFLCWVIFSPPVGIGKAPISFRRCLMSDWVAWQPLRPGRLPKYTAASTIASHRILITQLYLVKAINSHPYQFSYTTPALA